MGNSLRISDYGVCTRCGRVVEKSNLHVGPDGGRLGPECMKIALRDYGKEE